MSKLVVAVLIGVGCVSTSTLSAPLSDLSQGQTGRIEYTSITPKNHYDLSHNAPSPNVTVYGTLTLPAGTTGKVPAMVVAHHCDGITDSVTNLAAMLNSIGIATFVPDSFTPRGLSSVCSISYDAAPAVADNLYALKLLATHPRIDPNRIGIVGQSFGGFSVFNSAIDEVRKGVISDSLKFSAHVAMYPGCGFRYWSANMTGAPIMILMGALDDATPGCTSYGVLLRSLGPQVTSIIYPDAYHAWDNPTPPTYKSNATNPDNCHFDQRVDQWIASRWDTGEVFNDQTTKYNYTTSCLTNAGYWVGNNSAAKQASDTDIAIFLAKTFKMGNVVLPASQPDRIFNYLQDTYPQYLAPAGAASQTASGYYYRYYSNTSSYIATNGSGKVYYLSNGIGLIEIGAEAAWLNTSSQSGY